MKTELTQERVKELFDYDEINGLLLRKKDEHGRVVNRPCGHKPTHAQGYGQVNIDGMMYLTHRIIWLWHYGELHKNGIDHIDRNKMNNRLENLRAATQTENMHNLGMNSRNTSGFPGVSFSKQANKYEAYIWVKNKRIYLGYYATAEEAFRAYMLAKIQYHPTSPIAQQYLRELTLAG